MNCFSDPYKMARGKYYIICLKLCKFFVIVKKFRHVKNVLQKTSHKILANEKNMSWVMHIYFTIILGFVLSYFKRII